MNVTIKRRTGAAAVAAMLACGVTLSACSDEQAPEESTSSSSSASSTSSSPTSSTPSDPDGARAITAVKNLEKTSDELYRKPKMSNGEFGAYATDEVFLQRSRSLSDTRARGDKWAGRTKVLEPEATKRTATSQQVVACIDLTDVKVTDKNGDKVDLDYDRYEQVYTVEKSPNDGKWRVTGEEVKETC